MKKYLPAFVALMLLGAGCSGSVGTNVAVNNAPSQQPSPAPSPAPKPAPQPKPAPEPTPQPQPSMEKKIILSAQGGSGESGLVTFVSIAPKTSLTPAQTKVIIAVTGEPSGASQPAHVHFGSCPNPGGVRFGLNPVVNGKSETTLNVGFDEIFDAKTKMAVNIHKSAAEMSVYLACGNMN